MTNASSAIVPEPTSSRSGSFFLPSIPKWSTLITLGILGVGIDFAWNHSPRILRSRIKYSLLTKPFPTNLKSANMDLIQLTTIGSNIIDTTKPTLNFHPEPETKNKSPIWNDTFYPYPKLIIGPVGSGKSTLLSQIAHTNRKQSILSTVPKKGIKRYIFEKLPNIITYIIFPSIYERTVPIINVNLVVSDLGTCLQGDENEFNYEYRMLWYIQDIVNQIYTGCHIPSRRSFLVSLFDYYEIITQYGWKISLKDRIHMLNSEQKRIVEQCKYRLGYFFGAIEENSLEQRSRSTRSKTTSSTDSGSLDSDTVLKPLLLLENVSLLHSRLGKNYGLFDYLLGKIVIRGYDYEHFRCILTEGCWTSLNTYSGTVIRKVLYIDSLNDPSVTEITNLLNKKGYTVKEINEIIDNYGTRLTYYSELLKYKRAKDFRDFIGWKKGIILVNFREFIDDLKDYHDSEEHFKQILEIFDTIARNYYVNHRSSDDWNNHSDTIGGSPSPPIDRKNLLKDSIKEASITVDTYVPNLYPKEVIYHDLPHYFKYYFAFDSLVYVKNDRTVTFPTRMHAKVWKDEIRQEVLQLIDLSRQQNK